MSFKWPSECGIETEGKRAPARRREKEGESADMFAGQVPFLFSVGHLEAHLPNGCFDSSAPAVS